MQARLRFVEREERWWAWREKRGEQEEEAQGSVGSLGRFQRAQEAGDVQAERESRALAGELQRCAREGVRDRLVEREAIADLADGHQRRRKVATVMGERGGAHADL